MLIKFPAGLIEPLHHGVVFFCGGAKSPALIPCQQFFGRIVRKMRHHGRIPNKKGLLLGAGLVDKIEDRLDPFPTNGEAGISVAAGGVCHA